MILYSHSTARFYPYGLRSKGVKPKDNRFYRVSITQHERQIHNRRKECIDNENKYDVGYVLEVVFNLSSLQLL